MLRHCRRSSSTQPRLRQRRSVALHLFLFLSLNSLTAADNIVLRTNISPESVWVGQRMTLQIDVLGKDGWAQITDMDALEIPDCYLLPSGNSRVRLQEKIEGADYSGQRYELALYPQRDGTIQIPEIPLSIKVRSWGANSGTKEQVVHTEASSIEATLPAGVQNVQSFVASPHFTATQTWSSDAVSFTAGDALKRSIRLEATDLPAMLLPLVSAPELPYLSSYPETPELSDTTHRSTPTARRDETITYVFEANGTVDLPTYTFQWWDTTNETLQTITLPGRSVQLSGGATSATSLNTEATAAAENDSKQQFGLLLLALIAGSLSYYQWRRHCSHGNAEANSEAAQFKQLQIDARSITAAHMLQSVITWIATLTSSTLTTTEFLSQFADSDTQRHAAELLRDPSTQQSTLSNPQFLKGLKHARSRYLKAQASHNQLSRADSLLPPLND